MIRDRWLYVVAITLGIGLSGLFATSLILTQEHAIRERKVAALVAQNSAAARVALERANHDHAFLFAVCRALKRRDKVSASTTRALDAIEMKFHPPQKLTGSERDYYLARERVLNKAVIARNYIATFDCIKGMQKAVKDAPTEPPETEVSATP